MAFWMFELSGGARSLLAPRFGGWHWSQPTRPFLFTSCAGSAMGGGGSQQPIRYADPQHDHNKSDTTGTPLDILFAKQNNRVRPR